MVTGDTEANCQAAERATLVEKTERLFLTVMRRMQAHFETCSQEFDLSLPQAMALRNLGEARPMGELAGHLGCDASYITGIADSLEQRGLIERRADPADRRVKQLALTEQGVTLRRHIQARLLERHPVVEPLSRDEQRMLRDLLHRIVDSGQ